MIKIFPLHHDIYLISNFLCLNPYNLPRFYLALMVSFNSCFNMWNQQLPCNTLKPMAAYGRLTDLLRRETTCPPSFRPSSRIQLPRAISGGHTMDTMAQHCRNRSDQLWQHKRIHCCFHYHPLSTGRQWSKLKNVWAMRQCNFYTNLQSNNFSQVETLGSGSCRVSRSETPVWQLRNSRILHHSWSHYSSQTAARKRAASGAKLPKAPDPRDEIWQSMTKYDAIQFRNILQIVLCWGGGGEEEKKFSRCI